MFVLLTTITAFLIDFFAGGAFLQGGQTYFGFVFVFFLMRKNRTQAAGVSFLLYGLFFDLFNFVLPFGTFILSHAVFWLLLFVGKRNIMHMDRKRTFLTLCGMLVVYGFALFSVARLSASLFTGIQNSSFIDILMPVVQASVITMIITSAFIFIVRATRVYIRKWFFVT
ncbi:hypothetical protein BK004_03345 [bacterium CG10_46_32]|nr:MAG: hypothetical protein BK004_03345 [bacterium CG10_46_32]PIR55961.1 MAG: hypothetical protein COU73_03375 [Parcubacteria group bacterium CG10_big_fil_rev_8_21_14_0_10_46_32]